MAAYYNEHDPFAAQWLRELIKANLIAPGEVDERDIQQVGADDLKGFVQCHFFAGIGVWSYALRAAGWSDDTPVWTGSCPCQSFSASGQRAGFDDPRHLWPSWFRLIRESCPDTIFGEQVAKKDGAAWLDVVSADMESIEYAIGPAVFPACGIGAPTIRERLYFVAHPKGSTLAGTAQSGDGHGRNQAQQSRTGSPARRCSSTSGLADSSSIGEEQLSAEGRSGIPDADRSGETSRLEHADMPIENRQSSIGKQPIHNLGESSRAVEHSDEPRLQGWRVRFEQSADELAAGAPSLTNGFWRDCEWLWCRDGRFRPVEPGTFPLAPGITSRMDKLRGYGNALNAEQAKAFIEAAIECGIG